MRHKPRSVTENMHGLLESIFATYAGMLRDKYPNRTIRNATVFASAITAFERLGFIESVDARIGIPKDVPEPVVTTIKRARPPIWVPGRNFPNDLNR
jgi:hypothetical protein